MTLGIRKLSRNTETHPRRAGQWTGRIILAAAIALVVAFSWPARESPAENRGEILVFAAAGLTDALSNASRLFEGESGLRVRIDFASSGSLQTRISAGSRADLFFPASSQHLDSLGITDLRRDILTNDLVCVVPAEDAGIDKPADLAGERFARIAVGEPGHVPAGMYAMQALERLGLRGRLASRLVPCADVRAVLAMAESGVADVALVYRTDALNCPRVRIAFAFPPDSHDPIVFPAAVLPGAEHPEAARVFLDFLASPRAAKAFAAFGFRSVTPPEDEGFAIQSATRLDDTMETIHLSIRVSLVALLCVAILGIPLSLWLARRRGVLPAAVEGLLYLPLVIPPVVTGYAFLLLLGPRGPLGPALSAIGLQFALDWNGAVLAATAMAFPLFLAVARTAFQKVDPRLEEAARTLGASPARVFLTITLPVAFPGLAAAAALTFARAFGEFGATMMLAGAIPGRTRTVPQAIFGHLLSGHPESAWTLVVISILVGLAAIAAAHGLMAARGSPPAPRREDA